MNLKSWNIVWSLCFGSLAALIAVGNVLTIWIFLKQRLRKRAHFLLISLAVADLLVGLLTVPFYIVLNVLRLSWSMHLYEFIDILTGLTSVYTLAVISLERMYAIGWPLRHRTLSFRVYIFAIAIPWIMAVLLTSLDLLFFFKVITRESFVYSLILFQSTPLLVMCVAYCVIWKKRKSPVGYQTHAAREATLAKTLLMITGASLLTWLPFQTLNLLFHFNVTGYFSDLLVALYIIKILQFSNSLVNVIIYPFRIAEFKNALLQMLHYCVILRKRGNNEVSPTQKMSIHRHDRIQPCQELQILDHHQ